MRHFYVPPGGTGRHFYMSEELSGDVLFFTTAFHHQSVRPASIHVTWRRQSQVGTKLTAPRMWAQTHKHTRTDRDVAGMLWHCNVKWHMVRYGRVEGQPVSSSLTYHLRTSPSSKPSAHTHTCAHTHAPTHGTNHPYIRSQTLRSTCTHRHTHTHTHTHTRRAKW